MARSTRYNKQAQGVAGGVAGGGALGRSMEGSFSFLTSLGDVPEVQDEQPSPAARPQLSVPLNEKDFMQPCLEMNGW